MYIVISFIRLNQSDKMSVSYLTKSSENKKMSTSGNKISAPEMIRILQEFVGLDADGNGEITVEELGKVLRSMRIKLRLSETQIKRALRQIDSNGDGRVDPDELLDILKKFDTDGIVYKALHERSSIRQDFQRYDKDNSGFITKDELVQIIKDRTGIQVPESHIAIMMFECDDNNDDQINYEEFVRLMSKSCMQKRVL